MNNDDALDPTLQERVLERYLKQRGGDVIDLQDRRTLRERNEQLHSFLKVEPDAELPAEFAGYTEANRLLFKTVWEMRNFPELRDLFRCIASARQFYRPDDKARSRVSNSMFHNWAHYDLNLGTEQGSLAEIALSVLEQLGLANEQLAACRQLTRSRLGVYEVCVRIRDRDCERLTVRELITGHTYSALDLSGAAPGPGQLWVARLLPPTPAAPRHWVSFMSSYAVRYWDREAWDLSFARQRKRLSPTTKTAPEGRALHALHAQTLKRGSRQLRGPLASRNLWLDFAHFWGNVHPRSWVELQGVPDQVRHLPLRRSADPVPRTTPVAGSESGPMRGQGPAF